MVGVFGIQLLRNKKVFHQTYIEFTAVFQNSCCPPERTRTLNPFELISADHPRCCCCGWAWHGGNRIRNLERKVRSCHPMHSLKWLPRIPSLEVVFSVPEAIVTMVQYTAYPIKEECVLWSMYWWCTCIYEYMCIYKHVRFMLRCFLPSFVDLWGGVRVWLGTLNTVTLLDRSGREVWSQTQVSFVFHNCPSFGEQLNCVSRRAWFAWWTPLANTSIHI